MGSKLGVLQVAAKRLGLDFQEYAAKLAAGLKWCMRCRSWKPLGEFGIDNSRGDKKASRCANCRHTGSRSRPGKFERRQKRAAGLAWCKVCQTWQPVQVVYGGLCRPCTNAVARDRYASDLQYRLNRRQHVYSRKRKVAAIPAHAQQRISEEFTGKCAYCRVAEATTCDHIVPTSKGGRTTPGNMVPACAACNSSKKNQDVWAWMSKRGFIPTDELINRYILSECGLFG